MKTTITTLALMPLVWELLFNKYPKHLPMFWFRLSLEQLVVIAIILFFFIRKQIRKELSSLKQLIAIHKEICK
ncbi:MAG: hypothetical protein R6U66_06160 [Bacteroidales bacterium]